MGMLAKDLISSMRAYMGQMMSVASVLEPPPCKFKYVCSLRAEKRDKEFHPTCSSYTAVGKTPAQQHGKIKKGPKLENLLNAHGMQHTALGLSSVPSSQVSVSQPCMCLIAVCGIQQPEEMQALAGHKCSSKHIAYYNQALLKYAASKKVSKCVEHRVSFALW